MDENAIESLNDEIGSPPPSDCPPNLGGKRIKFMKASDKIELRIVCQGDGERRSSEVDPIFQTVKRLNKRLAPAGVNSNIDV